MTADYKQISQELYDVLNQVRNLMDDANGAPINRYGITMSLVDATIQKYEDETTRGTGRTTALYMKAITEALAKPGDRVEFIDHFPIDFTNALSHQNALRGIVAKLGYDIEVFIVSNIEEKRNRVILINKFKK